ncbi:MAG: sulfite reductase flavoprotein subunit alpha, partial [Pseudomonadota bacterium]
MLTPKIPDDAPFSDEQKLWLQGYLSGLTAQLVQPIGVAQAPLAGVASVAATAAPAIAAPDLHIYFGTQTGNSEDAAGETAEAAKDLGFTAHVHDLSDLTAEDLKGVNQAVFVCSTYGEGEMPDSTQSFWDTLQDRSAPRLEDMNYSVLALGDTAYDGFCQAGKLLDTRLEQLGAQRVSARADCDVDFEELAQEWRETTLAALQQITKSDVGTTAPPPTAEAAASAAAPAQTVEAPAKEVAKAKTKWTRANPYPSKLLERRSLSGSGSAKEILHYEFATGEDDIVYTAGDAIGVRPVNDPALVKTVLDRMGYAPSLELIEEGQTIEHRLTYDLDLRTPSPALLQYVSERVEDETLQQVLTHGDKEALDAWLWGKDVLDVLNIDPKLTISCGRFVELLKRLQHRAYSISSSPLLHPDSVHLTVATVRWKNDKRQYAGCASGYLADRAAVGDTSGLFVAPNKLFRPPEDTNTPIIMVGPGTGVAPFRAFLQERQAM